VVVNGAVTAVEVRLQPLPSSMSGRVTRESSDEPIAGAGVVLGQATAVTDADGNFRLTGLPPGTYLLRVTGPGFLPHETDIDVAPGASVIRDVSLAPAPGRVLVRVVDATTGKPIQGAAVGHTAGAEADELPCADHKLLVQLKRSREYRALRPRVAELKPIDSWIQEGLHFFVFQLKPEDGLPEAPVAVFAIEPLAQEVVSAVAISSQPNGASPEVHDLRAASGLSTGSTSP
jgi:hypothetical protein